MASSPPTLELARPTRIRYTMLAWACSLSLFTYIDRVCIKEVEENITHDLGLTPQEFAWVFAAFGLAYAMFEVPTGWLGDRFGPRKVLLRIILWWSLFTALTGVVQPFHVDLGFSIPWFTGWVPVVWSSLILLVLIRFLFGMGEAGAYPNIAKALREWFPFKQRGTAQGSVWLFARWGGAVAPPLIAYAAMPFGWRGAFYIFGAIGVVWGVCFWYFFRDSPREHSAVNDAERKFIEGSRPDETLKRPISWRHMLREPTLWWLSVMYFCSNAGWCFFITWDKRYYKEVLRLDDFALDVAKFAPLFFGGVACLLGGLTTDWMVRVLGRRWGRTLQGGVAYLFGSAFFLAALAVHDPALSVVFLCMASFAKDFAMGVSWATCLDIGHRYSGTVSGFMNMIGNLGTFFAPPIVAALAKRGDWHYALAFSGGMFFLAALGWLFIDPRRVIVYSPEDLLRAEAATGREDRFGTP